MEDDRCHYSCYFLITPTCSYCRECTYCGKYLLWNGAKRNLHFDHIKAKSKGGYTVVPTCNQCNMNKGKKGLKAWLNWLYYNDREYLESIIEYNRGKRHKVAQAVRDARRSLYGY
jgi:5-methylcytosine-specific restriction endonuclease McrA